LRDCNLHRFQIFLKCFLRRWLNWSQPCRFVEKLIVSHCGIGFPVKQGSGPCLYIYMSRFSKQLPVFVSPIFRCLRQGSFAERP
jgi:hypothetical protein